ncbi:assimilatory sulfite reductase [Coprinopsis marcescibilis]|uniref:assimilatory sulfite reductase (NADPH) n=1 Tax=Coprinopsis marcescibilis TaxID=230819 RepID=A0A5C3LL08_COPMA|nr:assimilatory sulfite reductase [Coprinopsis marcescibilis]
MSSHNSGWSTPLSSSTTLSSPPSPRPDKAAAAHLFDNPRVQASQVIEYISSRSTSTSVVYVYDVAEQVGFGTLTKEWAGSGQGDTAPVVDLQTRAGAGLGLVGRLSQGTSVEAGRGSVLTAYTTPTGLSLMAPAFAHLPPADVSTRLVVQVPTITPIGDTLTLSPTLSSLSSIWHLLPEGVAVLLSSTPQQAVDFAAISYALKDTHVVHLFDHSSTTREIGRSLKEPRIPHSSSQSLEEALQIAGGYSFFKYTGDAHAHTALVFLNGPLALAAESVISANSVTDVGVITVNVLRPWNEAALRAVLPSSIKTVHVVDEVPNNLVQGSLFVDVFSSLYEDEHRKSVQAHRVTPGQTQDFLSSETAFLNFVAAIIPASTKLTFLRETPRTVLLFGTPRSPLATVPQVIADFFAGHKSITTRLLTDHDVFSKPGGIFASRIFLSPTADGGNPLPLPFVLNLGNESSGQSDFLAVLDHSVLKAHSLLNHAKTDSAVLISSPWSPTEAGTNLSTSAVSLIRERHLRVFNVDSKGIASNLIGSTSGSAHDAVQNLVLYLTFVRLYLGTKATEEVVFQIAQKAFGDEVLGVSTLKVNAHAWSALYPIVLPTESVDEDSASPLKNFGFNAIAVDAQDGDVLVNGARLGSWHDAAKHILFPSVYSPPAVQSDEQYPQNPALRPEIPDRTFLVTCTVNRRLTPLEYDRNVFHLEFDTTGTGLKYSIGEALGIHGWNDHQEVLDFCNSYGVDPNRLITIPVPGDDTRVHTRTVLQALEQQIDLFGKPPKSFYTDLAEYATIPVDKYALRFVGSPEGASTFKKFSDKDTLTFADVLTKYPSARPGIERLCDLIGDIKPRHYSIASAQAVVGDRVDLLVVTVDWQTPEGLTRYGQCTRYLASLKIGQKVTVSIKPSVMKLPPNSKQPLIMAGLGTGAAPFRAFLQHLAWLADQGQEIGPVYYYFGSRYQAAEYLYGEEIEAWILSGIITKAGLAFSRDGVKKSYIQHKMLEDADDLAAMLYDKQGVFYLCGPTWPVPDVYEALVAGIVKNKGITATEAGEYLESLKEEERYVLEVY